MLGLFIYMNEAFKFLLKRGFLWCISLDSKKMYASYLSIIKIIRICMQTTQNLQQK